MHSKRCIEASFSSYPALKLVTVGCTLCSKVIDECHILVLYILNTTSIACADP